MTDLIYIKVKEGMFSYWIFPYLRVAGLSVSYVVDVLPNVTLTYKKMGLALPVNMCCVILQSKLFFAVETALIVCFNMHH